MANSLFLSLDGIDGCGKSTQCHLLAKWLRHRQHSVVDCADPGGTVLGTLLREMLLHQKHEIVPVSEALLFMASRAQLVDKVIKPALQTEQIVVSDRFLLANVVYQGHGGGLDPDQLWKVGRWSIGGLEPDLTLVLDVPVDVALQRRKVESDRLEARDVDFHRRVRRGFLIEAERQPQRIRIVDASGGVEATFSAICQEVEGVLAEDSGA